jgi:hypothetical protein
MYLILGEKSFKSMPAPITLILAAPVEGALEFTLSAKDRTSAEKLSDRVPDRMPAVNRVNNEARPPAGVLHRIDVLLFHPVAWHAEIPKLAEDDRSKIPNAKPPKDISVVVID